MSQNRFKLAALTTVALGIAFALGLGLAGAGRAGADGKRPAVAKGFDPLAANVGKTCTVQFRRNLLGASSDKPISPTIVGTMSGAGSAEYAVSGTLSQVTDRWVVVNGESWEHYIPRDTVLLVGVHKK